MTSSNTEAPHHRSGSGPPVDDGRGLVPGGRLASMGARFGGLLIDTFIIGLPFSVANLVSPQSGSGMILSTRNWILCAVTLAVGTVYSAYFVGVRGQSLGHRAVGIRVVDVESGTVVGPLRAALRGFTLTLTCYFLIIGLISPLLDRDRRQGWHDKAARSVVIPTR